MQCVRAAGTPSRHLYSDALSSEYAFACWPTREQPSSHHRFEGPAAHPLPTPLGENDGGEKGINVSELEKDMLLTFEEQENCSQLHAFSLPSPAQINQEPDQSGTDYGGSEKARASS